LTATATIRPGLLIALKSTVSGGVSYQRVDLEHQDTAEKAVAKWETTRVIEDPVEHDKAVKARGKALAEIRKLCSATSFGLLCPLESEGELDAAVVRARQIVDEHNEAATFTRVQVYVLKGRIAESDEEAARAIGQEISGLVAEMSAGIDKLDPAAIRDAANKARSMAAMLGDDQQAAVEGAIEQARKAARQIVKRVQKEGEAAAIVLADVQRGAIEKARIAFLDLDGDHMTSTALPAVQQQRFADLDLSVADKELI